MEKGLRFVDMCTNVQAARAVTGGGPITVEQSDLIPASVAVPQSSYLRAAVADKSATKPWYVVQTQPHAESRALTHLELQGYHAFCPRYRKTVRHARKAKSALAPLFPNYLFLQLDASRGRWRAVNGTRGVVRLIAQGETPQPMPCGIVESLQRQMRADGAIDWAPTFKIGQSVRITGGPFTDFVGTLEHLDATGRVRVLLDLLGRSVSVALSCDALMPAV